MIIRLRSPLGQFRVEISGDDLMAQAATAMSLGSSDFWLSMDPKGQVPLSNLKHGDMVHVHLNTSAALPVTNLSKTPSKTLNKVVQHPVDETLDKRDGNIKRSRGQFCKHGSQGMCEYCTDLPPYSPIYLEENKIKHMSFHAYLKQIREKTKVSTTEFLPLLDDVSYKVVSPCPSRSHGPYPEGICTKCQPSALVLTSQTFRMVDHVEFETPEIMETFINGWRTTGTQRAGFLFGRFEPYEKVPLGVKAVVSVIYEPLQQSAHDSIQLAVPDPSLSSVLGLASAFGMEMVGMIYTDLWDDGAGTGNVVSKRHGDSYFLSSAECVFAAQCQLDHPMISKYSSSDNHTFGSRFVTCVVSGDVEGHIDISAYQVSVAAERMVRDGIIEASVDPALMRVKASTNTQYVPEVFYKYKNAYGIMVQEAAKPTFPVEYLLVSATHGFPSTPSHLFYHDPTRQSPKFAVENRVDTLQSISALKRYLDESSKPGITLLQLLSDFHVLLYIGSLGILDQETLNGLLEAVKTRNDVLLDRVVRSMGWATFSMVLQESGPAVTSSSSNKAPWSCRHCTYSNAPGADSCEMCGLPPDQH